MGFELHLNKNGMQRLQSRNPWLFKGDLLNLPGGGDGGGLAPVLSSDGRIAGWAFLTPEVDSVARILSFDSQKQDLDALVLGRFRDSRNLRKRMLDPDLQCYRLINSEGDFLPGLVAECYGPMVYMESQLGFWRANEDLLKRCMADILPEARLVFSWNPDTTPRENIAISEYGIQFEISMGKGQKTGHYCDQRENRRLLEKVYFGQSLLDLFCYSGGFSLAVGKKAQRILAVDSSAPALEWFKRNAEMNGITRIESIKADVNRFFSTNQGEAFDAVICDPPKLVKRRAEKESGLRMYFHLNEQAMSRVRPGGMMMTFSCSGSVSKDEFSGLVAAAARKLGRDLQVISHLSAGPDHPALAALPETGYLKGILARIT
ncbi:MAG: class I SAM-dependent rRNA methyltransferase [Proteobacteria bacterium]|nr:class I SAM-dependent rRNA methyltransferase [Pseudomonadota bacterium]